MKLRGSTATPSRKLDFKNPFTVFIIPLRTRTQERWRGNPLGTLQWPYRSKDTCLPGAWFLAGRILISEAALGFAVKDTASGRETCFLRPCDLARVGILTPTGCCALTLLPTLLDPSTTPCYFGAPGSDMHACRVHKRLLFRAHTGGASWP